MTDIPKPDQTAVNDVFGETWPESSPDDGEANRCTDADEHERWLRDNVPPHYR